MRFLLSLPKKNTLKLRTLLNRWQIPSIHPSIHPLRIHCLGKANESIQLFHELIHLPEALLGLLTKKNLGKRSNQQIFTPRNITWFTRVMMASKGNLLFQENYYRFHVKCQGILPNCGCSLWWCNPQKNTLNKSKILWRGWTLGENCGSGGCVWK